MLEILKSIGTGFCFGLTIGTIFGFIWYRLFTKSLLEIYPQTGLLVKTKKVP